MNRAGAVIIIAGGWLIAATASAGGINPLALQPGGHLLRPSAHRILDQRSVRYPVVSVATQVVTPPRATPAIAGAKPPFPVQVRTVVVRAMTAPAAVEPSALQP